MLNPLERRHRIPATVFDADGTTPQGSGYGAGCSASQEGVQDEISFVGAGADNALQVNLRNLVLVVLPPFLIVTLNPAPKRAVPYVKRNPHPWLLGRPRPGVVVN